MAITTSQQYFYGQPSNIDKIVQAVQNPFSSNQFQQQFGAAEKQLQIPFQLQQQGLQDMFRSAGNMASGAFGTSGANLLGQQGNTLANLAAQIGGQIPGELTGLLNALKLTQHTQTPETGGYTGGDFLNQPPAIPGAGTPNVGQDPYAGLISALGGGGSPSYGNYTPGNATTQQYYGSGYNPPQGNLGSALAGGDWVTSPDGSVMQNLSTGEVKFTNPNMPGFAPGDAGGFGPQDSGSMVGGSPTIFDSSYINNQGGGFSPGGVQPGDYLPGIDLSGYDFSL